MQPGAEVALFHIAGQLGRFAQAQLVEGEKAVGADAQGVVTAGRETEHGQPLALRLRPLCGLRGHAVPVAWIGSRGDGPQSGAAGGQLPLQQQRTGQHGGVVFVVAQQHIELWRLQQMLPGAALGLLYLGTAWQAQQGALRGRPQTRQIRRSRQAFFVAARQHHSGKRTRQQLRQRHDGCLFTWRMGRIEMTGFECLRHPVPEIGQRPVRGVRLQWIRVRLPVQSLYQSLSGGVVLQPVPLAGGLQHSAHIGQPLRQAARCLQALAPVFGLQCQGRSGLLPGTPVPRGGPAGPCLMAQMRFDGVDIGAMESSNGSAAIGRSRSDQGGCLGQLEPCQHGVAVGLWYARAQQ